MREIQQGVANTLVIGPVVSNADGFTLHNSLNIAPSSVYLTRNGSRMFLKADTNTGYPDTNAMYPIPITAGDATAAGHLRVVITGNSFLPIFEDYTVRPNNLYPAIVGGTGTLGVGPVAYVNSLTAGAIDLVHDEVMEGTLTLRQVARLMLAFLAGKTSGGGSGTVVFRDTADSKDRISASVDSNGNRSAVTTDVT